MAFNNQKVLAIIPARGGSKSIPKKNIIPLNGKPIIDYSIIAGLRSQYIDTVLVSSDDEGILNLAKKSGAEILKRTAILSSDEASPHDVIGHVIDTLEKQKMNYDLVVLLQPTSPLRNEKHIDEAFELLNKYDSTSLISVYIPDKSPFKCFVKDDAGYLKGLINDEAPFMNRQDLPEAYIPNGAIYIFSVEEFRRKSRIPMTKAVPYIMNAEESIDIDTHEDIIKAERILSKYAELNHGRI